jgi:gamma-glutamylcyclotransferase (GGCT)/AIG2-like uncharacterized protein YtfP
MTHYLAYGSNLHPLRLQQRGVQAQFEGTVQLDDYRLRFAKRSMDGSAKCTIEPAPGHIVHAAIYVMQPNSLELLDRFEGLGRGYERQQLDIRLASGVVQAITYQASIEYIDPSLEPYHWYKYLVVCGAQYHGFPADYITAIKATTSSADTDTARQRKNDALLAAMAAVPDTLGSLA